MFGIRTAYMKNKLLIRLGIFVIVMIIIVAVAIYIKIEYEITSVTVNGNEHYTSQEIENIVFDKAYTYNSLVLKIKYSNKSIENVPFIEKIDVDIVDSHKVRINVYEKAVAGYVEYLGHYMYFDKDGIIVESSTEEISGIPLVTGLTFDHVILHEELPVRDARVFMQILDITHLLNKYEIETDRIAFDSNGNVTLYFGTARVSVGSDDYIDEKINEMHLLLPELKGYSGTLHMENYSGEESNFSFDKDEVMTDDAEESAEEDTEENAAEEPLEE